LATGLTRQMQRGHGWGLISAQQYMAFDAIQGMNGNMHICSVHVHWSEQQVEWANLDTNIHIQSSFMPCGL